MSKLITCAFCILSILMLCTSMTAQCPQSNESVSLDGQSEVDEFLMLNPSCDFIEELELSGDITDISGFSNLSTLNYLYLNNCTLLSDLSGFSNIDSIHNHLGFYNEMGFTDLCGLNNLVFIGGDLRLEGTSGIQSLVGLEFLNSIGDDITIFNNVDLESLENLETVISLGDDMSSAHVIEITGNPKLGDCCGVQELLETYPQHNWVIGNNITNCNSLLEIEEATCNFESVMCTGGTNDSEIFRLLVSPNPASDFITIENPSNFKISELVLIGLQGKVISTFESNANQLDISHIIPGIYFLKMKINNRIIVSKIIVSR